MSEYNKAVIEYLDSIGVVARIQADEKQNCPDRCEPRIWKYRDGERVKVLHNHGHQYRLTLTRELDGHKRELVLAPFWNSLTSRYNTLRFNGEIKPGAAAATPNVYDMLSCFLIGAWANQETFEEYCANFGESTDSRKAERLYLEQVSEAIRIQRFFSQAELEKLQELAS